MADDVYTKMKTAYANGTLRINFTKKPTWNPKLKGAYYVEIKKGLGMDDPAVALAAPGTKWNIIGTIIEDGSEWVCAAPSCGPTGPPCLCLQEIVSKQLGEACGLSPDPPSPPDPKTKEAAGGK